MSDAEFDEAYDPVCNACDIATRNSNDGGKLPCNNHKLIYMQRTYPVIHMDNFWDGEWTHASVDGGSLITWLTAVLEDFKDKDTTPEDYVADIGLSVIQMTKEDFNKVPEL